MSTLNVPKRLLGLVPAGWTAADVLAAGEEALQAIDGIGPASARQLIEAAEAALAEENFSVTTSAAPGGLPGATSGAGELESGENTPAHEAPPAVCEILLDGADRAVVGSATMLRGETRTVRYGNYEQAAAAHPGAFLVRRVGETKYHRAL